MFRINGDHDIGKSYKYYSVIDILSYYFKKIILIYQESNLMATVTIPLTSWHWSPFVIYSTRTSPPQRVLTGILVLLGTLTLLALVGFFSQILWVWVFRDFPSWIPLVLTNKVNWTKSIPSCNHCQRHNGLRHFQMGIQCEIKKTHL